MPEPNPDPNQPDPGGPAHTEPQPSGDGGKSLEDQVKDGLKKKVADSPSGGEPRQEPKGGDPSFSKEQTAFIEDLMNRRVDAAPDK